jgi:hypothetical protein
MNSSVSYRTNVFQREFEGFDLSSGPACGVEKGRQVLNIAGSDTIPGQSGGANQREIDRADLDKVSSSAAGRFLPDRASETSSDLDLGVDKIDTSHKRDSPFAPTIFSSESFFLILMSTPVADHQPDTAAPWSLLEARSGPSVVRPGGPRR